ncbi:MAG: Abi family protein [Xanthomonadaceae bacterium]|nr:Abi family protein [Xanthomonadaceae bacterium]MDZ4114460.1 Abi family protein [Xanthomonadaceae bacterium]MDZ4377104.1 Abi family protein [Xanthomonadaceae bacterium]
MRYDKPALSITDQAGRLKQRGLQFTDDARVQHYLTHIGYYRLSAYWLPFEQLAADGQPRNHQFRPGTTFEQVLSLYIFDRQLRLLVMEAIERIETAIRTHWAHAMAMRHGPHAHLDANLFKSPWQHASDIARMAGELQDSSETFIAHYRRQYSEPYLPPIWAVVETLTLGALSRWFKATKSTDAKREVAKSLAMPTIEVLEQVLHALTPVRNVCAHHGRLWNRRFTLQLPLIKRLKDQMVIERITATKKQSALCDQCGVPVEQQQASVQEQPARQIYNYLLVMAHLMQRINPGSSWRMRLKQYIQSASAAQQQAMGFPSDWEQMAIWQEKTA